MDHAVTLTDADIAAFDRERYLALPRLQVRSPGIKWHYRMSSSFRV